MSFILKIKRAETPFYARLNRTGKALLQANLPVPRFMHPVLRGVYHLHFGLRYGLRQLLVFFYREPLFRSMCVSSGKNMLLTFLPDIASHVKLYVGNDVKFFGHFGISSGRVFDNPTVILQDRVQLGHNVIFSVNKEIIVEEGAGIASQCYVADNDGHPQDPEARVRNLPPEPDEIKPVRICRNAWIGLGSIIMKGVTIGEGAIVGAGSLVVTDVPPFSLAIGRPARVVKQMAVKKSPSTESAQAELLIPTEPSK